MSTGFNLWPVAWITYTDDMEAARGGYALQWRVFIRPKYRDDEGIRQHELMHVRVWWAALFRPWIDRTSRAFKLETEARAFAMQTRFPDRHGGRLSVEAAADMLANPRYGFHLTRAQALGEIGRYL